MNRLIGIGAAAMLSVAMTGFAAAQESPDQPNTPQAHDQQTAPETDNRQSPQSATAEAQPQANQQNQVAREEENATIARQNQNNLLITEENHARQRQAQNYPQTETAQNAVSAAAAAAAQTQTAVKEAQQQNAQTNANEAASSGNEPSGAEQAALSPQALPPPYASAEALAPKPLKQGTTIVDAKGTEIGKVAQLTRSGDVIVSLANNGGKDVAIPAWRIVQIANGEGHALMTADQVANLPSVAQSDQAAGQHG